MKMTTKNITHILGGIGLIAIVAFAIIQFNKESVSPVVIATNFEECVALGNPVMESYPRQCRSVEGELFVEIISSPIMSEQPSPTTSKQPTPKASVKLTACAVGGCSGQLCGEASEMSGMVTTCEFRAEYACYRSAKCERQADKKCGWTQTPELKACLMSPPAL